jgi:flagellar basal-body rod protein FlgB
VSGLFGGAIAQLTRGLGFASARHSVLAQNVANVETPGYQARDLVFDDYLRPLAPGSGDLPVRLEQAGITVGGPRLVTANDGVRRADGNEVHLDRQMARIAENTLYQHTLVQVLAGRFNSLKQAISGRL